MINRKNRAISADNENPDFVSGDLTGILEVLGLSK